MLTMLMMVMTVMVMMPTRCMAYKRLDGRKAWLGSGRLVGIVMVGRHLASVGV